MNYNEGNYPGRQSKEQGHVHELQGIVKVGEQEDPHSHRFSAVTGEPVPYGANDHVHEVSFLTDYYDDHYHGFQGTTSGAIQVNDRHVHYVKGVTSFIHNHSHSFEAVTMINNPAGEEKVREEEYYEDDYYEDDYPYREDHYQWYQ